MAEELHLLHVMVVSLRDMMSKILVPSTLQGDIVVDFFKFSTLFEFIFTIRRSKEKLPFCSGLLKTCYARSLLLATCF